jgi:UDP-4-amino-4,6-dideoxy-N-acetyl-beta-L-altrosamine transaminase
MQPIPYATQTIDEADLAAVRDALTSGWLTQGPAGPRFEAAFAARHEVAHAVATCNATAALHLACLALGAGPGGRVWTSPNSFVASANCARYCGAEVDFVDIDPATRNLSVPALADRLVDAERAGALPSIVVPVDFAGLPADLAPIRALADRYGFAVLEDASHAVGAAYDGAPVGSRFAHASVFSFHPVKIITTGEGGLVATPDPTLAARLRLLRSHGVTRDAAQFTLAGADAGAYYYEQLALGFNYRMTDLQAALGCSQLARLDELHRARERVAARYDARLAHLPLRLPARVPAPGVAARSSWHLYAVEVLPEAGVGRDAVFARLRESGIGVNVHYLPIHLQPYYRTLGFRPGMFPAAEAYGARALSLPLFPRLTEAQQDAVVAALEAALAP